MGRVHPFAKEKAPSKIELEKTIEICRKKYGRYPNVMALAVGLSLWKIISLMKNRVSIFTLVKKQKSRGCAGEFYPDMSMPAPRMVR